MASPKATTRLSSKRSPVGPTSRRSGSRQALTRRVTASRSRASVHDWLPQFAELLRPSNPDDVTAEAQATLALAVIRGLMLDDSATGDQSRIDAAFAVFDGL
jgi:hypothetical protein